VVECRRGEDGTSRQELAGSRYLDSLNSSRCPEPRSYRYLRTDRRRIEGQSGSQPDLREAESHLLLTSQAGTCSSWRQLPTQPRAIKRRSSSSLTIFLSSLLHHNLLWSHSVPSASFGLRRVLYNIATVHTLQPYITEYFSKLLHIPSSHHPGSSGCFRDSFPFFLFRHRVFRSLDRYSVILRDFPRPRARITFRF
jgi:hypothetical protein